MNREKSSSITELVKIVAKEIFEQEMSKHFSNANKITSDALNNIILDLNNIGASWKTKEENLLLDEFTVAIKAIAKNHGRSEFAIKYRLKKILSKEI